MADEKQALSGKTEEPRVYGEADDSNREPPPEQGVRGEEGSVGGPPGLIHEEAGIDVDETSGVAFAEATGRAGPAAERQAADRDVEQPGGVDDRAS